MRARGHKQNLLPICLVFSLVNKESMVSRGAVMGLGVLTLKAVRTPCGPHQPWYQAITQGLSFFGLWLQAPAHDACPPIPPHPTLPVFWFAMWPRVDHPRVGGENGRNQPSSQPSRGYLRQRGT